MLTFWVLLLQPSRSLHSILQRYCREILQWSSRKKKWLDNLCRKQNARWCMQPLAGHSRCYYTQGSCRLGWTKHSRECFISLCRPTGLLRTTNITPFRRRFSVEPNTATRRGINPSPPILHISFGSYMSLHISRWAFCWLCRYCRGNAKSSRTPYFASILSSFDCGTS